MLSSQLLECDCLCVEVFTAWIPLSLLLHVGELQFQLFNLILKVTDNLTAIVERILLLLQLDIFNFAFFLEPFD